MTTTQSLNTERSISSWAIFATTLAAIALIAIAVAFALRSNKLRRKVTSPVTYSGSELQAIQLIPEMEKLVEQLSQTVPQ